MKRKPLTRDQKVEHQTHAEAVVQGHRHTPRLQYDLNRLRDGGVRVELSLLPGNQAVDLRAALGRLRKHVTEHGLSAVAYQTAEPPVLDVYP